MDVYVVVIRGEIQPEVYRTMKAAAKCAERSYSTLKLHFNQGDTYQNKAVVVKRCTFVKGRQISKNLKKGSRYAEKV